MSKRSKKKCAIISIALLMILKVNKFLPESVFYKVTEGYSTEEKGSIRRTLDNYVAKHGGDYH